jgi:hypothetical protein
MGTPGRRVYPAALAVLLLAGCALLEPEPQPPAPAARPPDPLAALPPAPAPPIPGRKPAPPAVAPALPGAAAPTPFRPDGLIGMTPGEAAQLLGPPAQRAEVAPATVWRYAAGDCELDLYFYLDLQSRVTRVLHYELRNPEGGDGQRCLERLVAEERSRDSAAASSTDRPR